MEPTSTIPRHVAIVMDGNGRWAQKRYLPRFFGHKAGVDTVVKTVNYFADRGVKYLTVYAFSSENWRRPEDEVSGLMGLVLVAVTKYLQKMADDGVRIRVIGDRASVSPRLRQTWDEAEALTADNDRIHLSVAFSYGGRWDIVQACRRAMIDGVSADQLSEELLSRYTSLSFAPDPDLFIRTGGEMRMSNFLLWQAAYSELYFTDCLWPDFSQRHIDDALAAFAARDRRFGQVPSAAPALAVDG